MAFSAEGEDRSDVLEADVDSVFDSAESVNSDLTSLKSSVFHYEYENGRRYQSSRSSTYVLPNDETEQERLDILHHVFRLTLNGNLCLTRLRNPMKILDIGTGTGIWAIEIGEEFPEAQVIGTDISAIQPSWIPPNVNFQIDNVNDEWAFTENSFDFIHVRCMAGSINDWPDLLKKALAHLKPGGLIELSECRTHMICDDNTFPADCCTNKWIEEFHRIARSHRLEFDVFPQLGRLVRAAGFHKVVEQELPCPIGTWPKNKKLKEIGRFFKHQLITGAIDSFSLALFTRLGGWSEHETHALLAEVRNEIRSNKMHVYTHCSYVTAQKLDTHSPEDAE